MDEFNEPVFDKPDEGMHVADEENNRFDESNESMTMVNRESNRVNTGLEKLDELLSGGLPENSITLVSGTPGSGKTILCYHYIQKGLNKGEKCLYLSSDERVEGIFKQAEKLGFDFKSAVDSGLLKFMYLDLDKNTIHKEMEEEVRHGGYHRVVLDSLTPVSETPVWVSGIHEIIPSEGSSDTKRYPSGSISATRMHIRRILGILNSNSCTSMITSEIPEGTRCLSRDTISEFLVDGIILMDLDMTMDRRKLTIRKMRATNHTLKPQDITISEGGIRFL
ncbi:MAG: AAA family ATPase [Thermoplasmatales archaeon]|nr:MAG: AAA family ATPase [Thermoplasmatales archaeon]